MGYNTTLVIYNDALDYIAHDPEFGKRLVDTIKQHRHGDKPSTFFARSSGGGSSTAGVVVESHHADDVVTVLVGMNTGRVIRGDSE